MASLFGFDITGLLSSIKSFFGPLGKLFDKLKETYDHLVGVFDAAQKLTTSVTSEIDAWRNFKQDIRIRQRVVNIETAIQKTRDLIEGIPAAWRAIVDVVKQVKSQIGGAESPVEDAQAAAEDIDAGGIKSLLEKFPKLARGLEKLLGVLAIIVTALETISNVIADIQTVVDEITRLRLEIEKLDTIFLSQSNRRKTVRLEDGRTIKIRVGKLHENF
jgi:hypothetical protein